MSLEPSKPGGNAQAQGGRNLAFFASLTERPIDEERTGRTKFELGTTGLDSPTGDSNKDRVNVTAEVGAEARYWSAKRNVDAAGETQSRYRSAKSTEILCFHGSGPEVHGSTALEVLGESVAT